MWHFNFIFEIRNSIIQVKAKTETSLFYLIFIFSDFFSSKIGEFVDTFFIFNFSRNSLAYTRSFIFGH